MKSIQLITCMLATAVALPLAAMPTREETARAEPVIKRLLASERTDLASGKKTRSEVADAALKLAKEADTEAAKFLLMKGAFVLYVKDGKVEKAAQTMNAIEKTITDLPPQSVTNMIDLALLGLPKKDGERLYLCLDKSNKEVVSPDSASVVGKETVDGYTWSYRIKNGEAEIVAEKDGKFTCAVSPAPKGSVTIPSMLGGVRVTSIGSQCFDGCKEMTSVTIPDGVISVGYKSFWACRGLKSATLPSTLKSIGNGAFGWHCALESLKIPQGVTSIGFQAFHHGKLRNLTIPASVASLGDAFEHCDELSRVTILGERPNTPDGVVFKSCGKLKELHVYMDAKSWAGMEEWQGKKLVFDAKVGNSTADVKSDVVRECQHINETESNRTVRVRKILPKLFPGWSLESEVAGEAPGDNREGFHLNHRGMSNVICVHPKDGRTPVVISRKVTLSGQNPCLFLKVSSWTEDFDSLLSVRVNGKNALPSRIICTPDTAPWEDIVVPLSSWRGSTVRVEIVVSSNDWCLEHTSFAQIEIAEGDGDMRIVEGSAVVDGYTWSYRAQNGKAEIVAEKDGKFVCAVSPKPTGNLAIPATINGLKVSGLGKHAFFGCDGLATVSLPSGMRKISPCAFYYCANLKSFAIPASVTRIDNKAFAALHSVRTFSVDPANPSYCTRNGLLCSKDGSVLVAGVNGDVVIPPGVAIIRRQAFLGRGLPMSVTVPASVTDIEASAFSYCPNLTSVTFLGERPTAPDNVFSPCNTLTAIHVSANAKSWAGMKEWQGRKLVSAAKTDVGAAAKNSRAATDRTTVQSIIDGMIKVSGRDFWLSETELTQGQWEAVMGNNPSRHKGANLPVECVSRDDCDVFLAKLNQSKEVMSSRFEFYIPTLPEWMYAAQAGGTGTVCCVSKGVAGTVLDMAWVKENSGGETHAVATKTPNAFGFYDMLGNVWEWMYGENQSIGCRHGFAFDDAAAECVVTGGWHRPRYKRYDHCGLRVAARVRPAGGGETCADAF